MNQNKKNPLFHRTGDFAVYSDLEEVLLSELVEDTRSESL